MYHHQSIILILDFKDKELHIAKLMKEKQATAVNNEEYSKIIEKKKQVEEQYLKEKKINEG